MQGIMLFLRLQNMTHLRKYLLLKKWHKICSVSTAWLHYQIALFPCHVRTGGVGPWALRSRSGDTGQLACCQ